MKKVLSVLMAVVMLLGMFVVTTSAATAPTITAKASKSSAKVGETITVTVSTSKNSKIGSATLNLTYNAQYFEVTGQSSSGAFEMESIKPTTGSIEFIGITGMSKPTVDDSVTTLFTVSFKVLKTGGTIKLSASEVYVTDGSKDVDVTSKISGNTLTISCSHANKKETITKQPTCTATGTKTITCKDCGAKIKDETIPATKHDFESLKVVKAATCTEKGLKEGKCKKCNTVAKEEIPAKGHTDGGWKITVEPTCTEVGQSVKKCSVCNEVLATGKEPKKPHTPGSWEVKTAPTCTKEGESVKKCTVCKAVVETRKDAKKAHTPGDWEVSVPSVDGKPGTKVQKCTVCKTVLKTEEFKTAKPGDIDGNGKVTAIDARRILKYVAGDYEFTPDQVKIADINGDGKVTAIDARKALQLAANED